MWLKRLVGIMMILTFAGLNTIVVYGLFQPQHTHLPTVSKSGADATVTIQSPTVSISSNPAAIAVGSSSGLTWTTTGTPDICTASGSWAGEKTITGAESTGRIKAVGTYTYTITCTNKAGAEHASTTVTVTATPPPASQSKTGTGAGSGSAIKVTYCSGRAPCYGKSDVARHGLSGNCWGYNLDRVIDISGFDAGYHAAKSGISSIQVSSVCGTNLAGALNGSVSAEGQTRNHNSSTKTNADANEIPYFVGYFDANKP